MQTLISMERLLVISLFFSFKTRSFDEYEIAIFVQFLAILFISKLTENCMDRTFDCTVGRQNSTTRIFLMRKSL